jgi:hypothetical protein
MSAAPARPTCWSAPLGLRDHRRLLRLAAGLTDELDALGRGHAALTRLLDRLEQHTPDQLIDAIRDIDQTIVTPIDGPALLDLARPDHDLHQLMRHGFAHTTDALIRMRHLTAALPWGAPSPAIDPDRARPVLGDVLALLDQAGHALTRADRLVVTELTSDPTRLLPVNETTRSTP